MKLNRSCPDERLAKLTRTAFLIGCLPKDANRADALVAWGGMGENDRIIQPIKIWESGQSAARFLLISSDNPLEEAPVRLDLARLRREPYNLTKLANVITQSENKEECTITQAFWTVDQIISRRITSLALFTAPYHLPRAFLSLLKALNNRGVLLPVILSPICQPPGYISPVFGLNNVELYAREIFFIDKFQNQGNIASAGDVRRYATWLAREIPA